jgi:hypothetical protein
MMLALGGLFQNKHIEWVTSMTYQAASGAGARHMHELLTQMKFITDHTLNKDDKNLSNKILQVEKDVKTLLNAKDFPKDILVDIFRPFLFYFFIINYDIKNTSKIYKYKQIFFLQVTKWM